MSVDPLSLVREQWSRVEAAESALPDDLPLVSDRVRVFEMLWRAGRSELSASADLFGPERERAIIAFQARLGRLGQGGVERLGHGDDVQSRS